MLAAGTDRGELARRRRALAQRLHVDLTGSPTETGGPVAAVAANPTVVTRAATCRALELAPKAAQSGTGMLVADGPGGRVLRLHADTFSVVFRVAPGHSPVLVTLDGWPGFAVRADTDPDLADQVTAMIAGVLCACEETTARG